MHMAVPSTISSTRTADTTAAVMSVGSEESWDRGTAGDGDDVGLSGSSAVELGETVGSSGGGIEAPLEWILIVL